MSSYTTLLGSYRMSSSAQVLPPARSSKQQDYYNNTSSSSSYMPVQARTSSRPASSRAGAASSGASVSKYQSPTVTATAAADSHRYYSAADSNNHYSHQHAASASTFVPKSYLSTSSSSSSASSSSSSAAAGGASAVLTQVQRTSSSSSPKSQVMSNAHHHKMRSNLYRPKWDPALPNTRYNVQERRPLLLLDLDETLVHATTQRPASYHSHSTFDFQFNVDMGANQAPVPVWVALRPYAKQFLYDIAPYFELAVFTASIKNYADKVCEALDPSGTLIQHRLYRDHCSDVDGVFVKDLSLLNRPLHRLAILDNSPHAYLFHPENSIPILSWFDDARDNELQKLVPMLIRELSQANEVYDVLAKYRATL